MTSDTVFNNDEEQNRRMKTRHFDIVQSEDDDEEPQLSTEVEDDEHQLPHPSTTANDLDEIEDEMLQKLQNDCTDLDKELTDFKEKHEEYVKNLDIVESLKTKNRELFDKYKKKIELLKKDVKKFEKTYYKKKTIDSNANNQATNLKNSDSSTSTFPATQSSSSLDQLAPTLSTLERLNLISEHLNSNSSYLSRISTTIPRKDPYLKVILGGVDVSILNKVDKWTYKQEYEKFKFIVTGISLVAAPVIWALTSRYRAFDAMFHFLLVWYYCTLTIRESILIVNGSNINRWWRAHHFIATVATGILLTWPDSQSYHAFRTQFFIFSFYLSFVQVLQFYYQRGCLYRLRALGETNDMDITVEGFHRWMFRGLSFLVPFLLVGYIFQFYNAYTLWQLAHLPTTHEWQVMVLAVIFFVLFLGNILTTLSVLREKIREKASPKALKQKYQSFRAFLSTNYHRRSQSLQQIAYRYKKPRSFTDNDIDSTSKDD